MYYRVYIKCNVLNNNNIILNDISFINKNRFSLCIHCTYLYLRFENISQKKTGKYTGFYTIFFFSFINSIALCKEILWIKIVNTILLLLLFFPEVVYHTLQACRNHIARVLFKQFLLSTLKQCNSTAPWNMYDLFHIFCSIVSCFSFFLFIYFLQKNF